MATLLKGNGIESIVGNYQCLECMRYFLFSDEHDRSDPLFCPHCGKKIEYVGRG